MDFQRTRGRKPLDYAWIIVCISLVRLAISYGIWYSFSVFFVALLKEFGWSRSTGAGAFSILSIVAGRPSKDQEDSREAALRRHRMIYAEVEKYPPDDGLENMADLRSPN